MSPDRRDSEYRPDTDPSVFSEPWLEQKHEPDSIRNEPAHGADYDDDASVEQGVWHEPAVLESSAPPADARTWTRWFRERRVRTSNADSLRAFLILCLLGGPFAIIGTMFSMALEYFPVANIVVFGPATEEVLKAAAVFYVVERRPYLFKSAAQLVLAVALSGLVFATIENIMYLHVYIPPPITPEIRAWRWYGCTTLHVTCCLISSIGLVRIWRRTNEHGTRPELGRGIPWLIAAVAVHGLYNFSVLLIETFLKPF